VCHHAEIDHAWRADTIERALWCLEERRLELASHVDAFVRADARTVQSAVEAATDLAPVALCLDEAQLQRGPAPPRDRGEIQAVRVALAQASSLTAVGRYKEALAVATAAREQADEIAWPTLQAEARGLEGRLHFKLEAGDDALRASKDAYLIAARVGAWGVAFRAALVLMDSHLAHARGDETRAWAEHAEVALTHAGDPSGRLEARRLAILAYTDMQAGALADALARGRAALALDEAALGAGDHLTIAKRLFGLMYIHHVRHEHAEALALGRRALAVAEAALGRAHPDLTNTLRLVAQVHMALHDHASALPLTQRALAIEEAMYGPAHPGLGDTLGELARIHAHAGDYPQALALARRGVTLAEATGEQNPLALAAAVKYLADCQAMAGDLAEAQAASERALTRFEGLFGPDHFETSERALDLARVLTARGDLARATALFERAMARHAAGGSFRSLVDLAALKLRTGDLTAASDLLARAEARRTDPDVAPDQRAELHEVLGLLHTATGEHAAARADFTTALALGEQSLGPDHPVVAHHLVRLAGAWLAVGAPQTALPLLERALAISAVRPPAPRTRARLRFYLARALVDTDGDLSRALAAANEARDGLGDPGAGDELAEVDAWLAEHGRR
jgi:tetratricopeptide (TPR) repeat protein